MSSKEILGLPIQKFLVQMSSIVVCPSLMKRVPGHTITELINILFSLAVIPGMEFKRYILRRVHGNILWQFGIQCTYKAVTADGFFCPQRTAVHIGMDAAVGAGAAGHLFPRAQDSTDSILQHLLYRERVLLDLPAVIVGAEEPEFQ